MASRTARALHVKITLAHIRPPIWRRVLVCSDTTLAKLHEVIQAVMPWHDSHLHDFSISARDRIPEAHERKTTFGAMLEDDIRRFAYEYDFGDSWIHHILISVPKDAEQPPARPICLAGKRAAPPEDSGGPWGYVEMLRARKKPLNENDEELVAWLSPSFDPEAFDLASANARLERRWPQSRVSAKSRKK